ncbi:ATP synthase epsilon chain [Iodidimonas muriae]|uniref:ATP synthase epsilon chain n=1 Tax=Iodidimonas muriae TaxID=261467 RepID=A0ABQ2L8N0_9PROT|nr:F0F1 ATP synthase subunit epsilon [Iodidimonas muriae]GER05815.1 ATP synthase epsilon chain [Kordiimonadales bacterium JCM 17843]GGO06992.1 ATP synthase epsilon chain [Iodidimonas muriae]
MAEQIHFELVSPERLLMDVEAAHVIVPGSEGEFGVLPGHAPFMSTLRPGMISVFEDESQPPKKLFLKGGFVEVNAKGIVVLAEDSIDLDTVDAAQLDQDIKNATEDLELAKDALALQRAEAKLAWMGPLRDIIRQA